MNVENACKLASLTVIALGFWALLALCAGCAPVRMSDRAVFQRTAESAVVVMVDDGGRGSGTVVEAGKGSITVLTCAHVVVRPLQEASHTLYAVAVGGQVYPAFIVAMDVKVDLALLVALGPPVRPLPVARYEPDRYSELYGIGAPVSHTGTASHAVLSSKHPDFTAPHQWQVTGFVFHGMSGGSFTNNRAELVCVPEAYLTKDDGDELIRIPMMGICVGLPAIRTFLHDAGVRL